MAQHELLFKIRCSTCKRERERDEDGEGKKSTHLD
jgi:hypothetical protein